MKEDTGKKQDQILNSAYNEDPCLNSPEASKQPFIST